MKNGGGTQDFSSVVLFLSCYFFFSNPSEEWSTDSVGRGGGRGGGGGKEGGGGGKRRRRRRRGKAEEGAVCRAELLWITWSSAGLRIYSSTAAVRGSGASCMLLPKIFAKQGRGASICWIQDSAALWLHVLFSPSACTLMLCLFPSGLLSVFCLCAFVSHCFSLSGGFITSHKHVATLFGSPALCPPNDWRV